MTLLLVLLQLLCPTSHAEVISERFVTIGYHNKETISLREHKVKNGKGYSIVKVSSEGKITGHTLTARKYSLYKKGLDDFLKPMAKKDIRGIASCDDLLITGSRLKKSEPKAKTVCLSLESLEKRKNFVRWWRKVSKNL